MNSLATQAAATLPAPASDEPTSNYYRLEVRGDWAGRWRPAVAGELNQTRDDDETASTFSSVAEAMAVFERCIIPERPTAARLVRSDGVVLYVVYFGER